MAGRKRGRPAKKPDYDRDEELNALVTTAAELFAEPYDDRVERSADAPSIRDVAQAMNTTILTARKILITAGYYSTELSRKVQTLHEQGCDVQQIMDQTGLKRASVHAYLPYMKGKYNLTDATLNAERRRTFRTRKAACEKLGENPTEENLWAAIEAFEGHPFSTEKGLSLKYTVKGGEIFFSRKEKSVTRATVLKAFNRARQIQKDEGCVSGPKKLGTFGASYLYPVFLRIGVCTKKS